MATNPFEDEDGTYHVLINDEGQHSLWPTFVTVPGGWKIIHHSDSRAACLEFINKNWTDMRPNSLIESMKAAGTDRPSGKLLNGSNSIEVRSGDEAEPGVKLPRKAKRKPK
jgi:MbtH protein